MAQPIRWFDAWRAGRRTAAGATKPVLNQYGEAYLAVLGQIFGRFLSQSTRTIVEYGTGASTGLLIELIDRTYGPQRPDDLVLLSIDNNEDWQRSVAKDLPFRRYLHLRTYDLTGAARHESDTGFNYATAPALLDRQIDLAYVDGRTRAQCVLFLAPRLADDGAIVLDDAARERYRFLDDFFASVETVGRFKVFSKPKVRAARPARSERSKAIVQVAVGDRAQRESAITRDSVARYASRIGAECRIVRDRPPDWPAAATKFAAHEVFQEFDRCILVDADVVIRDGAPDLFAIVPESHVGGVFEGSFVAPERWPGNPRQLYDLGPDYDPQKYINTGVVVLSRQHYALFKPDPSRTLYGDPAFEQAYINAEIFRRGLPLYELPREFNAMALFFQPFAHDWRYGWFIHLTGAPSDPPMAQSACWMEQGRAEGMPVLQRQPLEPAAVRWPRLAGVTRAMAEESRLTTLVPPQFHFFDQRRLIYRADLGAVVCALSGDADGLVVLGPYMPLGEGLYEIEVQLGPSSASFRFGIDVVHSKGAVVVLPRTDLRSDGKLRQTFDLKSDVEDIEFRLYGADSKDACLIAMTLRWL